MMGKLTVIHILFNFIVWLVLFVSIKKRNNQSDSHSSIYFIGGLIIILFSTFGFNSGDFLHYAELYENLVDSQFIIHVEPFYFWLCKILPENYFIWRFVIWGVATIFLIKIFKHIDCNPQFALFIFVLVLMNYFHNPRQTLGYVVLYYGVSLLFFPKKNKLYNILRGIMWIFLSSFLHKSMFIYILLIIISIFPLGKKLIVASILSFPVLYKSLTYLSSFVLMNSYASETSQNTGIRYLESDFRAESNIFGIIQLFINRLPIFLLLFYSIRNVYFKNEKIQYGVKIFLQYSYWLIYTSYLFMGQDVSAFLSNRFWDASLYPLTIFFAVYLYKKPRTIFLKMCFYLLLLSNLYNLSYSIFKVL